MKLKILTIASFCLLVLSACLTSEDSTTKDENKNTSSDENSSEESSSEINLSSAVDLSSSSTIALDLNCSASNQKDIVSEAQQNLDSYETNCEGKTGLTETEIESCGSNLWDATYVVSNFAIENSGAGCVIEPEMQVAVLAAYNANNNIILICGEYDKELTDYETSLNENYLAQCDLSQKNTSRCTDLAIENNSNWAQKKLLIDARKEFYHCDEVENLQTQLTSVVNG